MPGLALVLSSDVRENGLAARFRSAQREMLHAADYSDRILFAKSGTVVGSTGYPDYPVRFFSDSGGWVAVEGHLYDLTRGMESELASLREGIFSVAEPERLAGEWVRSHDGEYVIVFGRNDGAGIVVLTDPLGRLPLYLFRDATRLIVGRECKFLTSLKDSGSFDHTGWAQELWFGYPLGTRTLFENVSRVPGGLLLRAERRGDRIVVSERVLWSIDLDEKEDDRPVREIAAELGDTFLTAIRQRHQAVGDRAPIVLSLSGGHDSRSVGAGLKRAGVPFSAVTFRGRDRVARRGWLDAKPAERIARVLEASWSLVELQDGEDSASERRLVALKDGLNYVGMAFILPFLEELVRRFGRSAIYATGDGGDKLFPDLRPKGRIENADQLVRTIVSAHACMPSEVAESVLGLSPGTLVSEVASLVAAYPEKNLVQRAIRFQLFERGRKWLFEGEDRNRFFLWQLSPFFALPMFERAMRVPDRLKTGYNLYRSFQLWLDPRIAGIPHADIGVAIGSRSYPWKLRGLALGRRLPKAWKTGLKRWREGKSQEESSVGVEVARRLAQMLGPGEHPASVLDPKASGTLLAKATPRQHRNWRTLALLEERFLAVGARAKS